MTSALERLIANNEKAREPVGLTHPRDPQVLVRYKQVDLDALDAFEDVPLSDDRRQRKAATLLAESCIEILDTSGDKLTSIHPDGDTVTFESEWLAAALGVNDEEWAPADVASAFYPVEMDLILTAAGLRRASKLTVPNPT